MNRKQLLVASRWIPPGSSKVAAKDGSAVVYLWGNRSGRPCALGYIGSAGKPAFNYSFKDEKKRADYVAGWFAGRAESNAARAKRMADKRAELAKPCALAVGDVLYGSWGYDQTNVEFYEVVERIGKRQVKIRELCCESVSTGYMQGQAVPLPGQYTDKEALLRVVDAAGYVKLNSSCYLRKAKPMTVGGKQIGYAAASWTAYA